MKTPKDFRFYVKQIKYVMSRLVVRLPNLSRDVFLGVAIQDITSSPVNM